MSRRVEHFREAVADLTRVNDDIALAVQALMDARPELPGAAVGGTGGGASDPTGQLAAKLAEHNPVAAEIRELDRRLRSLRNDAAWLLAFVQRHTPKAPTDKQRREVERANTEPMEECSIMRELTNTFEPALCRSDLGGLLPSEQLVGRWVYDFARKTGRRPSKQEAQRHAVGQRVMVKA